jgi:hypothetical protein
MRYLRSIRDRIRRFRRIRAAKADPTPLREFVYLDEVSVYSLLASRWGALPTEYTQTQTRSVTGGLGSSLSATSGIAKTSMSSKSESTQSESTQVLRKSSVPAAFRDLYAGEEAKLALSPTRPEQDCPKVANWSAVEAGVGQPSFRGWVVDPRTLTRGELVEVVVELQTSQIYRFSSIFSALEDIAEDGRSIFPDAVYEQLRDLKGINGILRRMLIGLTPIKCRAVHYRVIDFHGRELIVHEQVLTQLPSIDLGPATDLYITGVTEEILFWKDVRRVLFSGSTYRILCRLNHSGVRSSWIPVKLVDVLNDVDPSLAQQIAKLENGMATLAPVNSVTDERHHRLIAALADFGITLGNEYGQTLTAAELLDGLSRSWYETTYQPDVASRRVLFQAMTDVVGQHLSSPPDPQTVARLREAAIAAAGLNLDGTIMSKPNKITPDMSATEDASAIIDSEIVAIYW